MKLIGHSVAQLFQEEAAKHRRVTCHRARPRLHVNAVGSGSAPCDREGVFLIASARGDRAQFDTCAANVATGRGSDLPAIAVLDARQDKRVIVLMDRGGRW